MELTLKIALVIAITGTLAFLTDYTRLTKGACWRDPLGLTLSVEGIAGLGYLVPVLVSAFFRPTWLEEQVEVWMLTGFLAVSGLVLFWRTAVFEHEARKPRVPEQDGCPVTEE